jgi:hypothetical protein
MLKSLLLLAKAAKLGPVLKTLVTIVLSVGAYALVWGGAPLLFLGRRDRERPADRLVYSGFVLNPDGSGTLGMILPSDTSPLSSEGRGVIIRYDDGGYVSDEDADGIDYDTLMKDTHKLFWAKELAFEGMPSHTLNYNVRAFGRRRVLVLRPTRRRPATLS